VALKQLSEEHIEESVDIAEAVNQPMLCWPIGERLLAKSYQLATRR